MRLKRAWTDDTAGNACPTSIPAYDPNNPAGEDGWEEGDDPYRRIYYYFDNGRFDGANEEGIWSGYLFTDAAHPHAPTRLDDGYYWYDANGQLAGRNIDPNGANIAELLHYSPLGHVDRVEEHVPGTSTYTTVAEVTYDANGSRLTATEPGPNGTTKRTLHLPMLDIVDEWAFAPSAVKVTRMYGNGAVRVDGNLSWQINDHQGSPHVTIDDGAAIGTAQPRRQLPYGEVRTAPALPVTDRDFLDAPTTAGTNIVHLGARQYDPHLRHFLSTDPIGAVKEKMVNAYQYGDLNPITMSDPTGMCTGFDHELGGCGVDVGNPLEIDPQGFTDEVNRKVQAYESLTAEEKINLLEPSQVELSDFNVANLFRPMHDGVVDTIANREGLDKEWDCALRGTRPDLCSRQFVPLGRDRLEYWEVKLLSANGLANMKDHLRRHKGACMLQYDCSAGGVRAPGKADTDAGPALFWFAGNGKVWYLPAGWVPAKSGNSTKQQDFRRTHLVEAFGPNYEAAVNDVLARSSRSSPGLFDIIGGVINSAFEGPCGSSPCLADGL